MQQIILQIFWYRSNFAWFLVHLNYCILKRICSHNLTPSSLLNLRCSFAIATWLADSIQRWYNQQWRHEKLRCWILRKRQSTGGSQRVLQHHRRTWMEAISVWDPSSEEWSQRETSPIHIDVAWHAEILQHIVFYSYKHQYPHNWLCASEVAECCFFSFPASLGGVR